MRFAPGTPQSVMDENLKSFKARQAEAKLKAVAEAKAKAKANAPRPKMTAPSRPTTPTPKPVPRPTTPVPLVGRPGSVPQASTVPIPPTRPTPQVMGGSADKMGGSTKTANGPGQVQHMPQPNTVPPANAMPMAPSSAGGAPAMKRGGSVRNKPAAKFSSGGSTSKASSRGDGIAQRGKTKGRYI